MTEHHDEDVTASVDLPKEAGAPLPVPAGADSPDTGTAYLLPSDIQKTLSPMALRALQRMSADEQLTFQQMYNARKKNTTMMVLLAIFFPIQFFLLGETGLAIAFWLTSGGCLVWYVVEWFLTPGRVRKYNAAVADQILLQMRALK